MNRNRLAGNWKQMKGRVREKWGQLTDDDLDLIQGRWEILAGKIQERYGRRREEVEKEIEEWFDSLDESLTTKV